MVGVGFGLGFGLGWLRTPFPCGLYNIDSCALGLGLDLARLACCDFLVCVGSVILT